MKIATKVELPVKIKNGKFASNLNTIRDILLGYEGHTIDVIFKKRTNKRSNDQNAYYWKVIVVIFANCIKQEWGELWDKSEVHEFLKANCNYEELINEDTGQVVRKTKSTTENSTTEQEDFHTKCRALALDFFNVEIPLPDKELKIKF